MNYDRDVSENDLEIIAIHPQLCFRCNVVFNNSLHWHQFSSSSTYLAHISKNGKSYLVARSQCHCFVCWDHNLLNMQKQQQCQHGTFGPLRFCILLFQPCNKLGDFFAHSLWWDHFFMLCIIFWPLRHEISPMTNKDFKCLLIMDAFKAIEDRVSNREVTF
jgi:hypothetical protein